MECKYGRGVHAWFPNEVHTSHGVGVWKSIMKGWVLAKRHAAFDIGNGATVRFWEDKWCGDTTLRRAFPSLYNIATNKNIMVSFVLQINDGSTLWNPEFRRHLQDWELDSLGNFFELLYAQKINNDRADMVYWVGTKSREFFVKSFYSVLRSSKRSFPWECVWKSKAPSKVAFFGWEAANEAILTGQFAQPKKNLYQLELHLQT